MRPYRTIINMVFLANLANRIAVLGFKTIELWDRFACLFFYINSCRKKFLQFCLFDSDKPSSQVNSRDSTFLNKSVNGVTLNSKDGYSFFDRDVLSGIWDLKNDL